MERMLVVVFDDEKKAYEGSRALTQLDSEDSISVHAAAVVKKNADGIVSVMQASDDLPMRTVGGTAIGALIGMLGGPIGMGAGAVAGAITGGIVDFQRSGVNVDFLNDASAKLAPGKWAVVADVSEEWVTPVDTKMEGLGGTVFRSSRENVEGEQHAQEVASLRADIAQLKAEQARSTAGQKAKLQAKIDTLHEKLQEKLEQAQKRSEQHDKETEAKISALKEKAAKAKGNTKAIIKARIVDIRKESKKFSEKLRADKGS